MFTATDTVACRLTPVGKGAIAVIAVSGPDAHLTVQQCFRPRTPLPSGSFPLAEIRYGDWCGIAVTDGGTAKACEAVVVVATTPTNIEVHCHGGPAAVAAICEDLVCCGVGLIDTHQWLARQYGGDIVGQLWNLVAHTNTMKTTSIALDQARGAMHAWASDLLASLQSPAAEEPQQLSRLKATAAQLLGYTDLASHLVEPWQIAVVGPPNVGKSSLMNQILGYQRSITFDQAGTTRDVVQAQSALAGWPVCFSDTAGIRTSDDPLESEGVRRALQVISSADLILFVVDASDPSTASLIDSVDRTNCPAILVVNKVDLITENQRCDWVQQFESDGFTVVRTSATQRQGIDELAEQIIAHLIPNPIEPGQPLPVLHAQRHALDRIQQANSLDAAITALQSLTLPAIADQQRDVSC